MRLKMIIGLAVLVPVLAAFPARADFSCTIANSSADSPHITDPSGDWNGIIGGNQSTGFGDINSGSADILGAWVAQDTPGKYSVHIQVASIGDPTMGTDINLDATFLFDNPASKLPVTREYVQARLNGRQQGSFEYGSYAPDPTTGVNTYTTGGGATGKVIAGTPGEIDISLPWAQMGRPTTGMVLGNPIVNTEFTLGTQQTGGLLEPIDDSANGDGCVDGITY